MPILRSALQQTIFFSYYLSDLWNYAPMFLEPLCFHWLVSLVPLLMRMCHFPPISISLVLSSDRLLLINFFVCVQIKPFRHYDITKLLTLTFSIRWLYQPIIFSLSGCFLVFWYPGLECQSDCLSQYFCLFVSLDLHFCGAAALDIVLLESDREHVEFLDSFMFLGPTMLDSLYYLIWS